MKKSLLLKVAASILLLSCAVSAQCANLSVKSNVKSNVKSAFCPFTDYMNIGGDGYIAEPADVASADGTLSVVYKSPTSFTIGCNSSGDQDSGIVFLHVQGYSSPDDYCDLQILDGSGEWAPTVEYSHCSGYFEYAGMDHPSWYTYTLKFEDANKSITKKS